jgi:fructan beta-fructosidase
MYRAKNLSMLPLLVLCVVGVCPVGGDDMMIADFEGDDFGNWEVSGECFGKGPARGPLGDQGEVTGFEGKGFVNTYHGGDPAEGIMTSPEFAIERDYLNFLIGGGDTGETSIELIIDGKIAFSNTGRNEEALRWRNWDVHNLRGRTARIRIVDTKSGGWGHLSIDSIMLSNKARGPRAIVKKIDIKGCYLNFPVENGKRKRGLRIYVDGHAYREFKVELAEKKTDVWTFFDVSELTGRQIELRLLDSDMGEPAGFAKIYNDERIAEHEQLYKEKLRPQFHFTTRRGWINDENGLVYYKGKYHLFYQHNPFGINWGNMHWGHTISDDLVHWKEQKIALYQQSFRDMAFSGTAIIDTRNESGFKTGVEDPMLLFFTSTGRGECIAYSNDAGKTFTEYSGNPVVEHEGRDPKVFWYEPRKKWVMVVYDVKDGERGFAFYDSQDLKSWRPTSWLGGFFECPDIFELAVQGRDSLKKWVIHGADGRYLLGKFDGAGFMPDSQEKIAMDHGRNFYAVYTYSNIPPQDGRTVQLAWMRGGKYPDMPFNQQLTFPCRVSLRSTAEGLRLCRQPVREIERLRTKRHAWDSLVLKPGENLLEGINGELFDIQAEIEPGRAEEVGFRIRGVNVVYRPGSQTVRCLGQDGPLKMKDGRIKLRLLIDRTSVELFGNDGLLSMSSCMLGADDNRTLEAFCTGGPAKVPTLTVWRLKSIWGR